MFSVVPRLMRSVVLLMEFRVLRARHGDQVRQSVVGADMVQVVDDPSTGDSAMLLFPDKHVFGAIAIRPNEDQNIAAAAHSASALPSTRLFSAEQTSVVTVDETQRIARVLSTPYGGRFNNLRALAAAAFTPSRRGLPVRRGIGSAGLLHTLERPRARPMALNELRCPVGVFWAGALDDRLTAAASTWFVAHGAMIAP